MQNNATLSWLIDIGQFFRQQNRRNVCLNLNVNVSLKQSQCVYGLVSAFALLRQYEDFSQGKVDISL